MIYLSTFVSSPFMSLKDSTADISTSKLTFSFFAPVRACFYDLEFSNFY